MKKQSYIKLSLCVSDKIKCPACSLEADPFQDFDSFDKFGNIKQKGKDMFKEQLAKQKEKETI